jgi:lysophospholipase-1
MERKPPIVIEPTSPPVNSSQAAAFVFVHGLGDEAEGVESTKLLTIILFKH